MVPRRDEIDHSNFSNDDLRFVPQNPYEKPEKVMFDKQNGSINLELGSYKSLKIPLSLIGFTLAVYPFLLWRLQTDPRMDGLPLLGSIIPVICLCFIYVCFSLVWGPRYMANRPAMKLNNVKMAYNLLQVIVCSYIFIQAGRLAWFWDYSYTCQPIDTSFDEKPYQYTRIYYLYYLTKMLDLLDTVFFVLNKKWTHISLLHVFHHAIMVVGIYAGAKYIPGGHTTFIAIINSFVHALMYGYYFLAALGPPVRPYLWWKKYLTMVQMIQFVAIFLHALQVFFIDCPIRRGFQFWICVYAVVFFYLFRDFYLHSYNKQLNRNEKLLQKSNDQKVASNGQKVDSNGIHGAKSNGIHKEKRNGVEKYVSNGRQDWKSE